MPLKPRLNPDGQIYYKAEFDVVLSFGLTELKAQVAWRDGKVRRLSFKTKNPYPSSLAFR